MKDTGKRIVTSPYLMLEKEEFGLVCNKDSLDQTLNKLSNCKCNNGTSSKIDISNRQHRILGVGSQELR